MTTETTTVQDFLRNYTGSFDFLICMKTRVMRGQRLSTRQYSAVERCMARERAMSAPAPAVEVSEEEAALLEWLVNYQGNFDFLMRCKAQIVEGNRLSAGQLAAVRRCQAREQAFQERLANRGNGRGRRSGGSARTGAQWTDVRFGRNGQLSEVVVEGDPWA